MSQTEESKACTVNYPNHNHNWAKAHEREVPAVQRPMGAAARKSKTKTKLRKDGCVPHFLFVVFVENLYELSYDLYTH